MESFEHLSIQNEESNFLYHSKIRYRRICILFLILIFFILHAIALFVLIPSKPEDRFEPCNFENKTNVEEILPLKKEINDTQKAIGDLSFNSTNDETLNSQKNYLTDLKEYYEYQKIHRTKCYIENLKHERFMSKLILYSLQIIYFAFGLFFFLSIFYYYFKSTKLELNDEGKQQRRICFHRTLKYFGLYLIFSIVIILFHGFYREFERDKLENLPLFVVENTQKIYFFKVREPKHKN